MSELPPFDQDLTLSDDHDKNHELDDATQLSSSTQFLPPISDESQTSDSSNFFDTQIDQSQPTIGVLQRSVATTKSRPSRRVAVVAIGFIVFALFILSLFLPPISILDRLTDEDQALNNSNFTPLSMGNPKAYEGLKIAIVDEGNADSFEIRVNSISAEDYLRSRRPTSNWNCESASLLSTYANPIGTVYSLETQGYPPNKIQLELDITDFLTNELDSTQVDWYGFDPALSRWRFLPFELLEDQNLIQANVQRLPTCLLTTQIESSNPIVGISINSQDSIISTVAEATTRLYPRGLHPISNGNVIGVLPAGVNIQNSYRVIPIVSNSINANVTDVQTVEFLLSDPNRRTEHVTQLVNLAIADNYAGLVIDYRYLPSNLREQFSLFLLDLRSGLQAQGRVLVVAMPFPIYEDGIWQTGAYDWGKIGQIADEILLRTPLDPQAFVENGELQTALGWITTQVSRQQLFLDISVSNVETTSDSVPIAIARNTSSNILNGYIELASLSSDYQVGDIITARLDSTYQTELSWDSQTQMLTIQELMDESALRTQWVFTPESLHYRLDLAGRNGLGGVVVSDLFEIDNLSDFMMAIGDYSEDFEAQSEPELDTTLYWVVTDVDGNVLDTVADDTLSYTISNDDTVLNIIAHLLVNNEPLPVAQQTIDLSLSDTVASVPDSVSTDENDVEDDTSENADTADVIEDEGNTTNTDQNDIPIDGDNDDTDSVSTDSSSEDDSGDIGDDSSVDEDDPVANVEDTLDGSNDSSITNESPTTPDVDFQLGGQIEQFSDEAFGVLAQTHMTWIRWQIRYNLGASPELVGARIDEAHDNGYKILISVTGQPRDLNDPTFNQSFATYLAGLAELGADAIEIWDAPNSSTNWLEGQIDPTLYVALLNDASTAIRAANDTTIIISAALQPSVSIQDTGQSATLWNDDVYRAGMAQAGVAEYIDCIGVRYIQGTVPPDAVTGDARGEAPIYYLPSLIERVNKAFDSTLPICFTSFGYLSGDGYGQLPINLSWASEITSLNQAEWLAQAVTMSANNGNVYLMMIWNIDFQFSSDRSEGYALIRGDDSCPACDTLGALSP